MIRHLIYDDRNACTQAEVSRLLPLVSRQRREYALRFRHLFGQWAALKTYEMLLQLLDTEGYPVPQEEWLYTPECKPYWPEGPCFSISHCQRALAVAIADKPIGIDIESVRAATPELVERTMNSAEQALIARDSDPARAFIRLWTRKEAFLKWKGTGIAEELHHTLNDTAGCTLTTWDGPDYTVTIAHTL